MNRHGYSPIALEISRADIEDGVRGCKSRCALSRALNRRFGVRTATVDGNTAVVRLGKRVLSFPLGYRARRFVASYDVGTGFALPGTYDLGAARVHRTIA